MLCKRRSLGQTRGDSRTRPLVGPQPKSSGVWKIPLEIGECLIELVALARTAERDKQRMYCWQSV